MEVPLGHNVEIVLDHVDLAKEDFYGVFVFIEFMLELEDFIENPKVLKICLFCILIDLFVI
jgi:hypothetical protein